MMVADTSALMAVLMDELPLLFKGDDFVQTGIRSAV